MSELYQQLCREMRGAKLRAVPDNCLIIGGQVMPIHEEIGTAEAAKILRCHQVTVAKLCESGKLREGNDWRRLTEGKGPYLIRREAVLEFHRNGKPGQN
jgi:hypothetical protein